MKEKVIGLKDLRENMSKYAAEVQDGKSLVVVKRSRPLFRLVPINADEGWETLVDFSQISPEGIPADQVLASLDHIIQADGQVGKNTKKVNA